MFEKIYKYSDVENIISYKSWSDKRKVNTLLKIDANLYANLGKDSTQEEKQEVKKKSLVLYRLIKTLDRELGDSLLYMEDKKQ